MIKDQAKALLLQGYSEDQVCEVLRLSHKRFRRLLGSDGTMTYGAAQELIHRDSDITAVKAAELYQVPVNEIVKARRGTITQEYTEENFIWFVLKDSSKSPQELAAKAKKRFGISIAEARDNLVRLNLAEAKKKPSFLKPMIIDALLSEELSQAEIAAQFKCQPSYVSMLASELNGGPKIHKTQGTDWPAVFEYLKTHNKSETAAHFGVSRAAINYQLNKK